MSEHSRRGVPVYLLVFSDDQSSYVKFGTPVSNILKAIPMDLGDLDEVWEREVMPYFSTPLSIRTMIMYREPENPLKEQAEKPAGWLPGDK